MSEGWQPDGWQPVAKIASPSEIIVRCLSLEFLERKAAAPKILSAAPSEMEKDRMLHPAKR
jgi:hypothetical protein